MIHTQLKINEERLHADFEELAAIGATEEGGVRRLALSAEDMRARAWFADKIEEAGLLLHDDDAANVSGILPGNESATRTLLVGSHLDSVPDGGRYDGSVGIVSGLECLRTIKEAGLRLPVHLEIIDFTDDEGNWRSLFGARAFAGLLAPEDLRDHSQADASFLATLYRAGVNPRTVPNARRDPASILGYIELHIEQGSRLERDDDAEIGIVSHIVGRTNYEIHFMGQAGHSGTTDMYRRRDALRGAALFITRAHDLVRERYGDGIFNCGNIDVLPGAFNVIPSDASLIFEVRHVDPAIMAEMEIGLVGLARECAATNALDIEIEMVFQRPAATMSDKVKTAISDACRQVGVGCMSLVSYSGHAAQVTSTLADSGMIFIPSVDGVSHNPREFSRWTDVVNGANVLLQTILNLASASRC